MKNLKIAIIQDELMRKGGAEQVVLCFKEAFPSAPIFTLAYNPETTYPEFKSAKVISSWFQKIAFNETIMKWLFFPLGIMAMKSLKIRGFDVVLMSTTYCAKYVSLPENTFSVCYCHQPFRLAWYPQSYSIYSNPLLRIVLKPLLYLLRKIDYHYAQKIDYFIANASDTRNKIASCYQKETTEIEILKPAVDCSRFYVAEPENRKDYYLVVCRLEYYKKVDIVIRAFNQSGKPLIIIGKGSKEAELKQMAASNITFKSNLGSKELATLYAECKALIFPQLEDYGITPLEANASGRPVIAYGFGGVLETTTPFLNNDEPFTSLFFMEQSEKALLEAIDKFEGIQSLIDPEEIRKHALKYDKSLFIEKIRLKIESLMINREQGL